MARLRCCWRTDRGRELPPPENSWKSFSGARDVLTASQKMEECGDKWGRTFRAEGTVSQGPRHRGRCATVGQLCVWLAVWSLKQSTEKGGIRGEQISAAYIPGESCCGPERGRLRRDGGEGTVSRKRRGTTIRTQWWDLGASVKEEPGLALRLLPGWPGRAAAPLPESGPETLARRVWTWHWVFGHPGPAAL